MDDSTNMSPTELQLRSENERLKKTMKDMEEMYSTEEEKSYRQIKALLAEQKDLKQKIENLQNRLDNSEYFSSSSSSSTSTFCQTENGSTIHSSFISNHDFEDSLLSLNEDYSILQDSFQMVSEEKEELESKVDKLNGSIKTLQEVVEDLRFKSFTQDVEINELNNVNGELCLTNQELYKTVCRLQSEIDDLKRSKLNETQMSNISLFDELEAVKQKELEETPEEEQKIPDIIVVDNKVTPNEIQEKDILTIQDIMTFKKKRCSFMKTSIIRFISVLSICYDYLALGIKLEFPILHFLSSDVMTLQTRPRIPQI